MADEAAGEVKAALRSQPALRRGLVEELGVLSEQRGPRYLVY